MGLLCPKCKTRYLVLLSLIFLVLVPWFSPSRFFCSLPTFQRIDSHTQVSVVCKVTEGVFDPLIIQISYKDNKQDRFQPWGTPLVTWHQMGAGPFTITLGAWPSSQFLRQQRMPLSTLFSYGVQARDANIAGSGSPRTAEHNPDLGNSEGLLMFMILCTSAK